jgi:hypothetical protein
VPLATGSGTGSEDSESSGSLAGGLAGLAAGLAGLGGGGADPAPRPSATVITPRAKTKTGVFGVPYLLTPCTIAYSSISPELIISSNSSGLTKK